MKFRQVLENEKVDHKSDTNQKFEALEQKRRKGRQKRRIGLMLWSLSVLEFRSGLLRPPSGGGGYRWATASFANLRFLVCVVWVWDCGFAVSCFVSLGACRFIQIAADMS